MAYGADPYGTVAYGDHSGSVNTTPPAPPTDPGNAIIADALRYVALIEDSV